MKVLQKINISLALLFLSTLLIAGQAQALTVSDVGDFDLFLESTLLPNSGEQEELDWISSVVDEEVFLVDKVDYDEDTIADFILEVTDDVDENGDLILDSYAIAIEDTTEYYLIKIGCGTGCDYDTYLFENIADLEYAYFTLTSLNISEILTISHITTTTSVVPVPAAVWLFGSAMLGLVGVARRRA